MNRNGPDPWCLPRFLQTTFWLSSSARYNWNCQRVRQWGDRLVGRPVTQPVTQWFRSLGGRRFIMVARRDDAAPEHPIRTELVARVRQEIQIGVYETAEKLEIALERLLAELAIRNDPVQ